MKASPNLEKGTHPADHLGMALGGPRDPCQDLQERALPSTVPSDDPNSLATLNFEGNVAQRPKVMYSSIR